MHSFVFSWLGDCVSPMKKFESSLVKASLCILGNHLSILFVLSSAVYITNDFSLPEIDVQLSLAFLGLYLLGVYSYLGITNNDFLLTDDTLEVVGKVPFFRRRRKFSLYDINLVLFRHDWTDTVGEDIKPRIVQFFVKEISQLLFPFDYKWVEITTRHTFRFYCFGLSYNYFDNKGPLFEDLHKALRAKGIPVKWTRYASVLTANSRFERAGENQSHKYFSKP